MAFDISLMLHETRHLTWNKIMSCVVAFSSLLRNKKKSKWDFTDITKHWSYETSSERKFVIFFYYFLTLKMHSLTTSWSNKLEFCGVTVNIYAKDVWDPLSHADGFSPLHPGWKRMRKFSTPTPLPISIRWLFNSSRGCWRNFGISKFQMYNNF